MENFWEIHDLKREISSGLITTASFSCNTEYSSSVGYVSSRSVGETSLIAKSPSDVDFVEYSNLTQPIILGWITGSIGKSGIETANSASIASIVEYRLAKTEETGTPWE
tara:strand:+ start:574 stop:900 length:327 start_codon:yes stop_codon:yes gene_type:complete